MSIDSIAIVDYGMGNLRSVQNAIEHVGGTATVVDNPGEVSRYTKIILPGVGAFSQAIDCLRTTGLADALEKRRSAGALIMGICLGMQLMCDISTEGGVYKGLGWFRARVVPFTPRIGLTVPHMGWNSVDFTRKSSLFTNLVSGCDAYFVHGYHVCCADESDVLATTEYGTTFHSIIGKGNLFGIQFHPEKSQEFGLTILKNFTDISC